MPSHRLLLVPALALLLAGCADTPATGADVDPDMFPTISFEPGEWTLTAKVDPEAPEADEPVRLKAHASIDDEGRRFAGEIAYRIVPDGVPGPWLTLRPAGATEEGDDFESIVTLPEGDVGIHFRVVDANEDTTSEFTDWHLRVE